MVRNCFNFLLVVILITSTFAILPTSVSAESPRASEFSTCLGSKTAAEDCSLALNTCNQMLDERYEIYTGVESKCYTQCAQVTDTCIKEKCSSDGCYLPDGCGQPGGFKTGRHCSSEPSGQPTCSADQRACGCNYAICKEDCEKPLSACREDCKDDLNGWWGSDTQTSDGYAKGNAEINDIISDFSTSCEAAKEDTMPIPKGTQTIDAVGTDPIENPTGDEIDQNLQATSDETGSASFVVLAPMVKSIFSCHGNANCFTKVEATWPFRPFTAPHFGNTALAKLAEAIADEIKNKNAKVSGSSQDLSTNPAPPSGINVIDPLTVKYLDKDSKEISYDLKVSADQILSFSIQKVTAPKMKAGQTYTISLDKSIIEGIASITVTPETDIAAGATLEITRYAKDTPIPLKGINPSFDQANEAFDNIPLQKNDILRQKIIISDKEAAFKNALIGFGGKKIGSENSYEVYRFEEGASWVKLVTGCALFSNVDYYSCIADPPLDGYYAIVIEGPDVLPSPPTEGNSWFYWLIAVVVLAGAGMGGFLVVQKHNARIDKGIASENKTGVVSAINNSNPLADWIKQGLAQGYDSAYLKNYLIQNGHAENEVEEAIRIASTQ